MTSAFCRLHVLNSSVKTKAFVPLKSTLHSFFKKEVEPTLKVGQVYPPAIRCLPFTRTYVTTKKFCQEKPSLIFCFRLRVTYNHGNTCRSLLHVVSEELVLSWEDAKKDEPSIFQRVIKKVDGQKSSLLNFSNLSYFPEAAGGKMLFFFSVLFRQEEERKCSPDEPFHNSRASKSVDRRTYVVQERRATDSKALKL